MLLLTRPKSVQSTVLEITLLFYSQAKKKNHCYLEADKLVTICIVVAFLRQFPIIIREDQ